jgi:hypothetical protein
MMRGATKHRLDEKRALAAQLAVELGQAELLAELVEGARLQALADTSHTLRLNHEKDYDFGGLLAATEIKLQDVHPVSVNGRSRVVEAVAPSSGPKPLSLETGIARTGGTRATYWGSWVAHRKYYWVTRSPDNSWSAGVVDLGSSFEALRLIDHALHFADEIFATARFDDWEQELLVARELGRLLLPPPLIDALKASSEPLSLVVAGSFICDIPLPALVLPGPSDERLVERAVIRVQPPLVLAENLLMQQLAAQGSDDLIVRVACLDPSGDLPHSRNYEIPSEILLTTPAKNDEVVPSPAWSDLANRANLVSALRRMRPGEPGVFVYCGHVDQNGIADGPGTSLVLSDGFVSAAELAMEPIPSHVIVSACSSSGVNGTGAGEWLGLAGHLLKGGARQIVATAWPIPDTDFTTRFERDLAIRVCASGDAASALRQIQLEAIEQWRSRHWKSNETLRAPMPRVWAAFQMIGVIKISLPS